RVVLLLAPRARARPDPVHVLQDGRSAARGGGAAHARPRHDRLEERSFVKFLLTSSGISNPSISGALVGLLGKPIAESSALFIPTAIYPFPGGGGMAWRAITGRAKSPLCDLGWKSLGVLELT